MDLDIGIHRCNRLAARLDFRLADIGRLMNDLALQVREVDDVKVDEANRADARGCEIHRRRRTEAARTDDEDLAVKDFFLSLAADLLQEDMARITLNLLICQRTHLAPPPMK